MPTEENGTAKNYEKKFFGEHVILFINIAIKI